MESMTNKTVLKSCPVCGEPTLVSLHMEWAGKDMEVPSECKCEREKREAREIEQKRRERAVRAEQERHACFPFEALEKMTFAADDGKNPQAQAVFKRYSEKLRDAVDANAGLLMYGGVGSGKTFYAACIANAAIDMGLKVSFTSVSDLSSKMGANFGKDRARIIHDICSKDVIILDDLGAERGTDASQENVYQAVNALCLAGVLIIATTNLTVKDMQEEKQPTLQRIYSRIFGACQPFEVKAKDRRREISKEKADFYKSLLKR